MPEQRITQAPSEKARLSCRGVGGGLSGCGQPGRWQPPNCVVIGVGQNLNLRLLVTAARTYRGVTPWF